MYISLFNSQCLASLEMNFSLVGLSEIYHRIEISPIPIDKHKERKKVYSENL